ncbi:MAG: sigma factor-like helix-turn-helix DNA-binding protein, partial [Ktedonobacterales bacterium]
MRKLAIDLREGLIRVLAARLLSVHDDSHQGDESRECSRDDTLGGLFDILTGPTMADLRPRELQVLYARLGLRDGSPATLVQVGERFSVTRERARQLEKSALDRLAADPIQHFTRALGDLVRSAVLAEGGAATIKSAADRIASWLSFGNLNQERATRLLAAWSPETIQADSDVLVASPYSREVFDRAQSAIRQVLQTRHGISRNDLVAEALVTGGDLVIAAGPAFVAAVLRTMPDVAAHGDIYQPARRGALQACIVQAMRSLGRPAHFTEIATKYRTLFLDDDKRKDNSIHAFFDRFPETFVLVGNGTFVLAEWGYDPHINSVPTLVEHILEQSERPVHVDEVIERATGRYRWKTVSISAQFSTNPRIHPFGNGFFGLKDRRYGPFDASEAYVDVYGESAKNRERLVVGSYTNTWGHRVVQVRLTPATLSGAIHIVSRPLREILPTEGTFLAECWCERTMSMQLHIGRSRYDLHGLGPFFGRAGVRAGDYLFIEQLIAPSMEGATVAYRLALATPENVNAARQVVGLGPENMDTLDADVLHYTRDPERVKALVTHALAHPWAA